MFARLVTFVVLFLAGGPPAFTLAGEIYKWTDADGKVHFGDRPPTQAGDAEVLTIENDPQAERSTPSDAQRRARRERLLQSYEKDRADKKLAAAKDKEQRAEMARRCVRARDNLEQMRRASYIYDLNEAGERVIRSDEQREQSIHRLEKMIADNCRQ